MGQYGAFRVIIAGIPACQEETPHILKAHRIDLWPIHNDPRFPAIFSFNPIRSSP
jgi:hypothetical protein